MSLRISRLFLAVLSLGLASVPARSLAEATVPVQQVVSRLQQQTRLPIFVPSLVPLMKRIYVSSSGADANSYSLNFDVTPGCGGSTACRFGGMDAERGGKFYVLDPALAQFNPANVVEPVSLVNGVQGQFVNSCGAYCLAYIEWQDQGVLYRVHIKNGRKADVITLANSALQGGVRKTTAMAPQSGARIQTDSSSANARSLTGRPAVLASKEPGTPINIRDGAGTDTYARHIGYAGDQVELLTSTTGSDGQTWYRVRFHISGATGWVRADFITFGGD